MNTKITIGQILVTLWAIVAPVVTFALGSCRCLSWDGWFWGGAAYILVLVLTLIAVYPGSAR